MGSILLPIQWNGFPAQYCFSTWQQLGLDISNAMNAVLANGRSFYNLGDTKPAPEFQIYPWLNTLDGRWYIYNGAWLSRNWRATGEHHWEVFANESDIWSWDGGDGTDPRPTVGGVPNPAYVAPTGGTGAMWMKDTAFDGRCPVSPGALPSGATVGYGATGGEDLHTLLLPEIPSHTHPVQTDAVWAAGRDTKVIAQPGDNAAGPIGIGATGAAGGNTTVTPVVTTPHNNMQPYLGMVCIVRTNRTSYIA